MTIVEKYAKYREQINNGDIILVRGNSVLARLINWGDAKGGRNAYFNHALVVLKQEFQENMRLFSLESEAHGVTPNFLSQELLSVDDFVIVRPIAPQEVIDKAVNIVFNEGEKGIPYNYGMLFKVLMARKFGYNSKKLGSDEHKEICSVFAAQTYGGLIPLKCYSKEAINQPFITPQDIIRFADPSEVKQLAVEVLCP